MSKINLMGLRDLPCPCGFLLCVWQWATLEGCVMSYGSVNVFLWIFVGQEMKTTLYKLHVSYLEEFALRRCYSSSNAPDSGKLRTLRSSWPNRRQAGTSLGHSWTKLFCQLWDWWSLCAGSYEVKWFGMHMIWSKLRFEEVNLSLFEGLR